MRAANDDLIVVCAGKQLASNRKGQGQGRGICSLWYAENSRHSSLENLLASHRGELRPKAAEIQNYRHSRMLKSGTQYL